MTSLRDKFTGTALLDEFACLLDVVSVTDTSGILAGAQNCQCGHSRQVSYTMLPTAMFPSVKGPGDGITEGTTDVERTACSY